MNFLRNDFNALGAVYEGLFYFFYVAASIVSFIALWQATELVTVCLWRHLCCLHPVVLRHSLHLTQFNALPAA